jgi:Tol biopolymer transport system component
VVKRLFLLALAAFLVSASAGAGGTTAPSRIAFGRDLGGLSGDLTSIYTIRPDGSGLRRVTVPPTRQALGGDSGPVWAPGGRSLVFERNLPYWGADRMRLVAVSARGGAARQLTTGPFDAMPSFSPDGHRIAFTRVVQSVVAPTASLFTVDGGGRHLKPLLADGIDLSAAWSPDGRTIAFSRLESTSRPLREATLYLADADGSHVRSLGTAPVHGLSPAWSPDGTRLAFVSFDDANAPACPAASCPPSGELYVIGADGSDLRRLTRSKADDEHPSWSPDGSRIAFASGFDVRSQGHAPWLMVIRASGGRVTRIGRVSGVLDPSWSPAGVR